MQEMDAREVLEWMAYEMTIDPDTRERLDREIESDHQKALSDEERGLMIKQILCGLVGSD